MKVRRAPLQPVRTPLQPVRTPERRSLEVLLSCSPARLQPTFEVCADPPARGAMSGAMVSRGMHTAAWRAGGPRRGALCQLIGVAPGRLP